jgi:hypothetical protein
LGHRWQIRSNTEINIINGALGGAALSELARQYGLAQIGAPAMHDLTIYKAKLAAIPSRSQLAVRCR